MIKVLVVEDHPIFRAGAATTIATEPDMEVVGEVSTAPEALELTRQLNPDVVLMDIRLQGTVNGIELARQVREENPDVRLVVLTNYSNEPYIRAMMEVGVEGYVLKDTPPRDVMESVRMVMDGRTVFSKQISQAIVRGYLSPSSDREASPQDGVTERELEVLELLIVGAPNTEIAERLHISVGTVQFHLTNIYGKLGVRSRGEAVIKAARDGLIVIDE